MQDHGKLPSNLDAMENSSSRRSIIYEFIDAKFYDEISENRMTRYLQSIKFVRKQGKDEKKIFWNECLNGSIKVKEQKMPINILRRTKELISMECERMCIWFALRLMKYHIGIII